MQTVKDFSTEALKALISEVAEEELREVLAIVDAGLAIRPVVRDRLLKDLQEPRRDGENIPTSEQTRRRGLECVVLRVSS
jgi:hypothetical protein